MCPGKMQNLQNVLEGDVAKRAQHYFTESARVSAGGHICISPNFLCCHKIAFHNSEESPCPLVATLTSRKLLICSQLCCFLLCTGIEAWSAGNLQEFGRLMSESGLSSIYNYECGK